MMQQSGWLAHLLLGCLTAREVWLWQCRSQKRGKRRREDKPFEGQREVVKG
jgi:hypothetical protein